MRFIRQVMVITAKDLRAEMRTKEAINASFAFAIVVLLILSFAFEPTEDTTREISGGLLWIVFLFAGTLILNRSFARELPNDCLDALIAAPVPGAALFLGKGLANFALILAVEFVALPVFGIFYNVRWARQFWQLMLVLALGTWGLTAIGTVVAVGAALVPALFAYGGWQSTNFVAEELKNTERDLPRALVMGTIAVVGMLLIARCRQAARERKKSPGLRSASAALRPGA